MSNLKGLAFVLMVTMVVPSTVAPTLAALTENTGAYMQVLDNPAANTILSAFDSRNVKLDGGNVKLS